MNIKLHSPSSVETFRIGTLIGKQLKGNELILLNGELGVGKTIITKGIASALGIDPREIVSPTFTLANEFRFNSEKDHQDDLYFMHLDLYRLGPLLESPLPEIDDHLYEGVIVVEWAQYLNPSYFNLNCSIEIFFHLDENNENSRSLEINTPLNYIKL